MIRCRDASQSGDQFGVAVDAWQPGPSHTPECSRAVDAAQLRLASGVFVVFQGPSVPTGFWLSFGHIFERTTSYSRFNWRIGLESGDRISAGNPALRCRNAFWDVAEVGEPAEERKTNELL
jgi:hypothetical protein